MPGCSALRQPAVLPQVHRMAGDGDKDAHTLASPTAAIASTRAMQRPTRICARILLSAHVRSGRAGTDRVVWVSRHCCRRFHLRGASRHRRHARAQDYTCMQTLRNHSSLAGLSSKRHRTPLASTTQTLCARPAGWIEKTKGAQRSSNFLTITNLSYSTSKDRVEREVCSTFFVATNFRVVN